MQQVKYSKVISKIRGGKKKIKGQKGNIKVSRLCNKQFKDLPDAPVVKRIYLPMQGTWV